MKQLLIRNGKLVIRNGKLVLVNEGEAGDCECCCDLAAAFSVEQTGTFPDFAHEFTDTSTTDCAGGKVAWNWDFGDGGTSTSQNPTHEFPADQPGPWLVTLEVEDGCGCIDEVEMLVHRIVNCGDARLWARDNINSWDYSVSGVANGICADCTNANTTGTTDTQNAGAVSWRKDNFASMCLPVVGARAAEVFVQCGDNLNYDNQELLVRSRVLVPDIGNVWASLGISPTISTGVFAVPIVCDEHPSSSIRCNFSAMSITASANY